MKTPNSGMVSSDSSPGYRNANNAADPTCFIEFMLSAIKDALLEVTDRRLEVKSKAEAREHIILNYLSEHGEIANGDVRKLLSVSAATANRVLNSMAEKGMIIRFRKGKLWAYQQK